MMRKIYLLVGAGILLVVAGVVLVSFLQKTPPEIPVAPAKMSYRHKQEAEVEADYKRLNSLNPNEYFNVPWRKVDKDFQLLRKLSLEKDLDKLRSDFKKYLASQKAKANMERFPIWYYEGENPIPLLNEVKTWEEACAVTFKALEEFEELKKDNSEEGKAQAVYWSADCSTSLSQSSVPVAKSLKVSCSLLGYIFWKGWVMPDLDSLKREEKKVAYDQLSRKLQSVAKFRTNLDAAYYDDVYAMWEKLATRTNNQHFRGDSSFYRGWIRFQQGRYQEALQLINEVRDDAGMNSLRDATREKIVAAMKKSAGK